MTQTAAQQSTPASSNSTRNKQVVLDVNDLRVHYSTPRGDVIAVNGISFQVYQGETVGLVGESGCGKTTTAMALLRLIQPPGYLAGGHILLEGKDVAPLTDDQFRELRWKKIALIPQGAMNSLNPVMRIRDQIGDAINTHEGKQDKAKLKERILDLLNLVGLPARVYDMYPHELSGGMKQRVCIAMGISLNPPLLIADEPTSALDVVVQRVVAQTLMDIRKRLNVSMIMIGHDMGLQAQLVDRLIVMYAGNIVEIAPVRAAFKNPLHPYTQLLIASIPSIREKKPLKITEGLTHDLRNPPPGCPFQFRCPHVKNLCRAEKPKLKEYAPEQLAACHMYEPTWATAS